MENLDKYGTMMGHGRMTTMKSNAVLFCLNEKADVNHAEDRGKVKKDSRSCLGVERIWFSCSLAEQSDLVAL